VVHAEGLLPTSGIAIIVPPAVGEPWDHYQLSICILTQGALGNASGLNCTNVTCSPVAAPPANTSCPLGGLQANTEYSVEATAVKADGTASRTSLPDNLWTPTDE